MQRWGFPSKQNPAHNDHALTSRVKELWEKNTTQKDMLDMLQAEGFRIGDRELMRLRTRFKLFLRERRSKQDNVGTQDRSLRAQREGSSIEGRDPIDQLAAAILQEAGSEGSEGEHEHVHQEESRIESPAEPLDSTEALRRQLRQQELQAESDEKWRARKRRRRTRGWAGLPADAPGEPPRFPSETTLDESKAYLNLDNRLYAQIRDKFQVICRDQGVIKKTVAGPEKWAGLLRCLIRESRHLSPIFQQFPEVFTQVDALWKPKTYQTLSLDVICQDVTKRMRVMETRMSIPEAKSALSLNPAQTREVKHAFHDILKADHFTNKFEAGERHWNELKQRWVDGSDLLKVAVTADLGEAERTHRLRAIEVLARDVMKRLRAESTRISRESGQIDKATHRGPGPGPAPPSMPHASSRPNTTRGNSAGNELPNANPRHDNNGPRGPPTIDADPNFQIDPSLLLAASDAAILPSPNPLPHTPQHQPQHPDYHSGSQPNHSHNHTQDPGPNAQRAALPPQQQQPHPHPHTHNTSPLHPPSAPPVGPPYTSTTNPLPIYFRLDPQSVTPLPHKTVWLSVLQGRQGVDDVRTLAAREHPGTVVLGLQGVLASRGGEVKVGIDDDSEMGAYLGHVRGGTGGGGGKATFVVLLGVGG